MLAVVAFASLFLCCPECARLARAEAAKKDLAKFEAYLTKAYPNRKWHPPAFADGAAAAKAYPGVRLCYVSDAQTPPGGQPKRPPSKSELEKEERLSLRVRIGADGVVKPLLEPSDYCEGLMKIASEEDAKTAAAAILSVQQTPYSLPQTVAAQDVAALRLENGWSCALKNQTVLGRVAFDAKGRCTAVALHYVGGATAGR